MFHWMSLYLKLPLLLYPPMYTCISTQFCLSLGYNNHTTYALPQWPRGFSKDVTLCVARDAIERARKLTADPFSFQCTQHVGPIMPWVLAWVPWHQSAQPFCNSAFSSDIQGNRNRITTRKERWSKVVRGVGRQKHAQGRARRSALSVVHTNLATHWLWPMYFSVWTAHSRTSAPFHHCHMMH